MRKIKGIIIHCSATKPSMNVPPETIKAWHVNPKKQKDGTYKYKGKKYKLKTDLPQNVQSLKGNGWTDNGYHFYITRDGALHICRPIELDGAHCKGNNKNTVGICMEGGIGEDLAPQDNFTPNQWYTLENLVENLLWKEFVNTDCYIKGHTELCGGKKACPSFDVQKWREKVAL